MYYAEIYLRRNNEKSTYKLSTSYLLSVLKNHLAFGIWNILCKYVVPDTEGIKTCTLNVLEVV